MLSKVYTTQVLGLSPSTIHVEVDMSKGLHSFSLVGLPDKVIEESKERITAAIKNSGFTSPSRGNKKVIVSLAPAHIRKEGSHFDLAIALGILASQNKLFCSFEDKIFIGELSLNGDVRPVRGILLSVKHAKDAGFSEIYVPYANKEEASLIHGIKIYPVRTLSELVSHLDTKREDSKQILPQEETLPSYSEEIPPIDFSDIRGQEQAKRALEIAAAGNHNIALFGPPGTGKTLLAKAFSGILPPLSFEDMLTVTGIHSVAGHLSSGIITRPPFKAPHHTSSYVSLVGGGTWPRPGEITLAHKGVLFLDEFPEFEKRVIESLRQPLEDKIIHISRAKDSVIFPADFTLVAAMNLCPCGNTGLSQKECVCPPSALLKYKRKISGPIMDRIDLWTNVPEVPIEKLRKKTNGEESETVRKRILRARTFQKAYFSKKGIPIDTISSATVKHLKTIFSFSENIQKLLDELAKKFSLSARGYHKTMKVAFTIASLEEKNEVEEPHILEAFQYRPKDIS
jgi:magnesium chelatase family protein